MKKLIHLPLFIFLIFTFSHAYTAPLKESEAIDKLKKIHAHLTLLHGSLLEEYPEQVMATMYISKRDQVLELGSNVGRNSCVIASILKNPHNLVAVESDPFNVAQLIQNRDHNHLSFHIEGSAISKVPLVQCGWVTMPCDTIPPGYFPVKIISYKDLKQKYNKQFNVLVADCEGALYYILRDDESMLADVDTIIVENDYTNRAHYDEICLKFISYGFQLKYNKAGGWGPCQNEFFQVWQKP